MVTIGSLICALSPAAEAEVVTDKQAWERARLIPVSGITGPDEQERRGVSALLAVINSVREFGRAITAPLGAPAGIPMAYIEVPFTSGEKSCGPTGSSRLSAEQHCGLCSSR